MISILFHCFRNMRKLAGVKPLQIMILFIALVLYSATGYMYFELPANPQLSWGDAFWWSLVTMTTVGYGDLFPVTAMGRICVGFPTMLLGVGILGYVLSLLASAILESRIMEVKGMKTIKVTDHVVICNYVSLDKTGELVREIKKDDATCGAHIVIVDNEIEELPAELQEDDISFVKGAPSHEAVLLKANINNCRSAIVQAATDDPKHSDSDNLRIVLMIESLNKDVYTVVECLDPSSEVFFRRANCDSVVCIASLSGQMLVQEMQDPGVASVVSELTSNTCGRQFYVMELNGNRGDDYQALAKQMTDQDALLIGLRRDDENHLLPPPDFKVKPGDKAILIAAKRPRMG